jgi:hypothetical protein
MRIARIQCGLDPVACAHFGRGGGSRRRLSRRRFARRRLPRRGPQRRRSWWGSWRCGPRRGSRGKIRTACGKIVGSLVRRAICRAIGRRPIERLAVEWLAVECFPVECFPVERGPIECVSIERLAIECLAIECIPVERKSVEQQPLFVESDGVQQQQ